MSKTATLDVIFNQNVNAITDALQTSSAPNWWPIDQVSASGTTTFPTPPTVTFSANSTLTVAGGPMKNNSMAGAGKLILTNNVGGGGFSARYYEHPDYLTVDQVKATISVSGILSVELWNTTLQFTTTVTVPNYDPAFVYFLTLKIYSNFCGVMLTKLINNQAFGYATSLVVPGIQSLLTNSTAQGLLPGIYRSSIVTQSMLNFCNICLIGTTNTTLKALGQDIPSTFNAVHRKQNLFMRDLTTVGATLSYIHDTVAVTACAQFVTQARNIAIIMFDWNTHSSGAADAKSKIASTAGILSSGGYEVWVVAMFKTTGNNAINEEVNDFIRGASTIDRVIDLTTFFPGGLASGVDYSLTASMTMFSLIDKVLMASADAVHAIEQLNVSEKIVVNTSATAVTNANLGINTDGNLSLFNTTQNYIQFANAGTSDGPFDTNNSTPATQNLGTKLLLGQVPPGAGFYPFPTAIGVGADRYNHFANLWLSAANKISFLTASNSTIPTYIDNTGMYTPTLITFEARVEKGVYFSTSSTGLPSNTLSDRIVFSTKSYAETNPTEVYKIGRLSTGIYFHAPVGGLYNFYQDGTNLVASFGGSIPSGSPTADTGFRFNQTDRILISATAAQTTGANLDLSFKNTRLTGTNDTSKWRIGVDASNNLTFGIGSPVTNYMSITQAGAIQLLPNTTSNQGIKIDKAFSTVDGQNAVEVNKSAGAISYVRTSNFPASGSYLFAFNNTCISTTSVIQLTLSFSQVNVFYPLIVSYSNQISGQVTISLYNAGPIITSSFTVNLNFNVF